MSRPEPKWKVGDRVLLKPEKDRIHPYHDRAKEWEKRPVIIDNIESFNNHYNCWWYHMTERTGHRYLGKDLIRACRLNRKNR